MSLFDQLFDSLLAGLCNPYAEYPFLREVLGYKRPWVYYLAMVLDPILRFNWIFYAIYAHDLQQIAVLSFFVGFSEVCRRGIWTLFRVENEHCTNVGRFRASRDVPLPYDLPSPSQTPSPTDEMDVHHEQPPANIPRRNTFTGSNLSALSTNIEAQQTSPSLRRRATLVPSNTPIMRGIARVGTAINKAHAQDFERKRKPIEAVHSAQGPDKSSDHQGIDLTLGESSDEEEDEEVGEEIGHEDVSTHASHGDEEARLEEQAREDMRDVEDVLRRRKSAVD